MLNKNKAFTLIELLVVIAIIGLLATISVISLNNARAKARDAKRVADVRQVQTALELFFNDKGYYPTIAEFNSGSLYSTSTSGTTTYMAILPSAPSPTDGSCDSRYNQFIYSAADNGATYNLSFCLGNSLGSLNGGGACATASGLSNEFCPCTENTICGLHCFYGGQIYNTVAIGNQCWFKNNLNIGTMIGSKLSDDLTLQPQTNNGIIEKYCYDYVKDGDAEQEAAGITNCDSDGGLYQWEEAMQYSVVAGTQGICPTGWHIPTDLEQDTLDQYLNDTTCDADRVGHYDCDNAITKLQVGGISGFESLLTGFCESNGSFNYQGTLALFWSSSMSGPNAFYRALSTDYLGVYRGYINPAIGFSVRCLKS